MDEVFKIAIISDLHCTPKESERSVITNLHTNQPGRPSNRNPIEAFRKLISEQKLTADILLCPGDITDKVNDQGFYSGWSFIEEMSRMLSSKKIYATLGNHDVASRSTDPSEAFRLAKNLKYNFPLPEENQQNEFWSNNFCLIEEDDFRLLVYNTVHDHYNADLSKKVSIDSSTLAKIEERLKMSDKTKFGIAMTHHHPINHYSSDYSDVDFIDKGDLLMKILEDNSFNLFVHGHKHQPMLRELNSIPILASGSFSCIENLKETESENLFHIIEIYGKKGVIKSWEYGPVNGWHQKNSGTSFPNITGFGYFDTIEKLAYEINQWFETKKVSSSTLKLLKKEVEDVFHINPQNQKKLEDILKTKYSIQITPGIYFGDKASINLIVE